MLVVIAFYLNVLGSTGHGLAMIGLILFVAPNAANLVNQLTVASVPQWYEPSKIGPNHSDQHPLPGLGC
jgi:hypothetical protein